jgi:2-dehydro-3-deoxygalactonokinase
VADQIEWVAVDWGTSNLRAWAMGGDGSVVASASSDNGMGRLEREQFPAALQDVASQLGVAKGTEVLICGMAGARQGWLEAPYLEAPTDLRGLHAGAVRPPMPDESLNASILPGVCQRQGDENVMRGEETQLLGLASLMPGYKGLVCLPGTHSKWALLRGTTVERFTTAMTGEVFELLRTQSVLRHSVGSAGGGAEQDEGFAAGASAGLDRPGDLLGQLFRVRAASLLSDRGADWSVGYLSGLLIGTEIAANRNQIGTDAVPLIGSTSLCRLYKQVLEMAGARAQLVDATEAVLAGLKAARSAK